MSVGEEKGDGAHHYEFFHVPRDGIEHGASPVWLFVTPQREAFAEVFVPAIPTSESVQFIIVRERTRTSICERRVGWRVVKRSGSGSTVYFPIGLTWSSSPLSTRRVVVMNNGEGQSRF
jgi:hypothetical protein